jgi:serine/threonine protein kinase
MRRRAPRDFVARLARWLPLLAALVLVASTAVAGPAPVWPLTIHNPAQPVAQGGGGKVFQAFDRTGRSFAVKLNHDPNVTLYDAQRHQWVNGGYHGWPQFHGTFNHPQLGGQAVNVTDWVPGTSLHEFHPRDTSQAVRVTQTLLGHLGQLHAYGVVHQDVKPANANIDKTQGSPSTKLLDFGQLVAANAEEPGSTGTPEYKAPEQWQGGPRTPATDTYGAAGVLVYMLTRQHPFAQARQYFDQGLTAQSPQVVQMHAARAVLANVPNPGLRGVLWKALSPNPAERYQSAAELSAALAPYAMPVAAAPPPPARQVPPPNWRWPQAGRAAGQ